MWYVVQTPVGREAEAAEKLNHFYRDKAEKPCFVLSKERTWRMGGVYYVDTEVMNPLIADQYISTVSSEMSGGAGSISECWFGSASIWNGSPLKKRGREISERTSSGGFFSHRPAVSGAGK